MKEIITLPVTVIRGSLNAGRSVLETAITRVNPWVPRNIGKIAIVGEQCAQSEERLEETIDLLQHKDIVDHSRSVAVRPLVSSAEGSRPQSQQAAETLASAVVCRYVDTDVHISALPVGTRTVAQIDKMIDDQELDHIVITPEFTAQRLLKLDQSLQDYGGGIILAKEFPEARPLVLPLDDSGKL